MLHLYYESKMAVKAKKSSYSHLSINEIEPPCRRRSHQTRAASNNSQPLIGVYPFLNGESLVVSHNHKAALVARWLLLICQYVLWGPNKVGN